MLDQRIGWFPNIFSQIHLHPIHSNPYFLGSTFNFGQLNPLERCPIFRNEPVIASRKVEFPGGTANCIDTST
jgi:hypothetical protein